MSHEVEKGRALFEGIAPVGSRFSPTTRIHIHDFRMVLRAMGNPTVRSRASPAATCQLALEARKLIKLVLGLVVRTVPDGLKELPVLRTSGLPPEALLNGNRCDHTYFH